MAQPRKITLRRLAFGLYAVTACFLLLSLTNSDFLTEHKQFLKVKQAFRECEGTVISNLNDKNISITDLNILIVVYKEENKMLLYVKNRNDDTYQKVKEFPVCYASGELGPKRREGDHQVPEGFYHINIFNPHSTYFLSLGINYPNKSDLLKTTADRPGDNIFIHGHCASIGCIAMGDAIKEIYVYAVHAKNNGQHNIPVYIFPFEMNALNTWNHKQINATNPGLVSFWNNLWQGYIKFSTNHKELRYSVNNKGDYVFD